MKGHREHRVPLSDDALRVLELMQAMRSGEFVFPGHRPGKPLSNTALLMVLRRMECGEVTTHGFRSSFRTWAAERTGFHREVVEAALAHVVGNKVESRIPARRPFREAPPADGRMGAVLRGAGEQRGHFKA
jgi:integrase